MSVSWSPSWAVTGPATIARAESLGNSETATLLARMTTQPSMQRRIAIDNLIGALKVGGVWAKLDALYVLAAHEVQTAVLNWVSTNYNLTTAAAPTFVANRYIQGNSSTQFYDTGFNPITASSPKFVQNSAHLAVWQTTAGGNNPLGATSCTITPATPNTTIRLNAAGGQTFAAAAATGHFIANRVSSSNIRGHFNGASSGDIASTSSAPGSETFYICARNQTTDTFNNSRITVVHFGSSLSDAEALAAYNALNAYLLGVGAV